MHCDNLTAVLLAANPVLRSRTKHMEIDLFFVRELVLQKKLRVHHIIGTTQVVEFLQRQYLALCFLVLGPNCQSNLSLTLWRDVREGSLEVVFLLCLLFQLKS